MAFFASARERRLWLWTLAVMVAIYSTLGPAGTLVGFLRERGLLRLSVAAVLVVAVGVVGWRWLRRRPGRGEIAVVLLVAGVYGWTWLRIPLPEERTHLIEYGVVAWLVFQALLERRRHGRRVPAPALVALAVASLLGWLDEGIQALLPNRVYDLRDVGFNLLAAVMAIGASVAVGWARRRFGSGRGGAGPPDDLSP